MAEDFKQRVFADCRVTLREGDTKDSLLDVNVACVVTGCVCCVRVQWVSVSNDVAVKTITRGDHFRVINGWSACCVVGLVDLCQNLPVR